MSESVPDRDKQSSDTMGPKKANEKGKPHLALMFSQLIGGRPASRGCGDTCSGSGFLSKKKIITCPRRKEEVKKSAQMAHMAITELHVECGRS